MAKYNLHAGHNPDGKVACGAVGLVKESTEARKVKNELLALMKINNTVYDTTVNDGKNAADVLERIVKECNKHTVKFDVSLHLNSGAKDKKGNDKTTGVEVLLYDDKNEALVKQAEKVLAELEKLGFKNRGIKYRPDLYFLRETKALAMLIEIFFVDDADDVELYKKVGAKGVAKAIAKGLDIDTTQKKATTPKNPTPTKKPATSNYYKKYTGNSEQVDAVLKAIGVPAKFRGSYKKRATVAKKNGISNYVGSAKQNQSIIALARKGKLKKV